MNKKISIVGGVPNPIGGVTTFILRLVCATPAQFKKVIDLYPSPSKLSIPIEHRQLKNRVSSLFLECANSKNEAILFNFSTTTSLTLLALTPKRSNRWGLILHNGSLSDANKNPILRALIRVAIKKIDAIGILSDAQTTYYQSIGATQDKLFRIQTYIPRTSPSQQFIENNLPKEILQWKESKKQIYICSGYPTKIYQHLDIIKTLGEIWKDGHTNIRLALFLYGPDSDGIFREISRIVDGSEFAKLYQDKHEDVFNASLAIANGYIRMNTVDSFGIAVADAISFGTPTIATNVCSRFPGAHLISPTDFEGLKRFVLQKNVKQPLKAPYQNKGLEVFLGFLAHQSHSRPE